MSVSNNGNGNGNGYGNMFSDLKAQDAAAQGKRVEPSDPADFLRWVRGTLRDQRDIYNGLSEKHKKLSKAGYLATVGLKRLGNLVKFNDRIQYEYLVDLHRDFTFRDKNIGYTLQRCSGVLDETTMTMQLVGETLMAPLADRHKKIGVQKELGLRLRDTDADFDRCSRAVAQQDKIYRQLSEGIQKLMNQASIKLPPKVKEDMNREDQVARLAIMHKKSLEKGKDVINSKSYIPPKTTDKISILSGWGDTPAEEATTATETEVVETSETEKSFDPKVALASTTVGVILGVLIFYVLLSR